MKPFFFRILFFFVLALIQVSVVNNENTLFVFPLVFSAVATLAIIRGFERSWLWAVICGVFIDALLFHRVGMHSGIFVVVVAFFSFLSRHWIYGHEKENTVFFGGLMWMYIWIVRYIEQLIVTGNFEFFSYIFRMFSGNILLVFASFLVSIVVFAVIFLITSSFERYVSFFERSIVGRQ